MSAASLLSKKRDFEYQNGTFANAALIFAAFARPDDYLLFRIQANRDEFIKVVPVQQIKPGAELSLKGTVLINAKFDKITRVELLTEEQAASLTCKSDPFPLGASVHSLSVVKDILLLDSLFKSPRNSRMR